MTELPIVALMVGNNGPKRVVHVMVQSAEDTFIDAKGARALVEIMNDVGVDPNADQKWELRKITPELLLTWANGKRLPQITKDAAREAKQKSREIATMCGGPIR